MKNRSKLNLQLSAITLGVLGLFAMSSAMADDEELKALTQPKSSVQVEMIGVDANSAKFGEYNGLYGHQSGAYPNGALSVRGGSAYTNNEQGDTTRWSVTGDNLGLTSRSANASIADQGSWSIGVNFDQLQHNISNSYQTPYQGNIGSGLYTLPSNAFGSTVNKIANTQSLPAGILGDYGNVNISSTRMNTTLNGTAIVDKNLNFTFDYNHLVQSGAKLGSMESAINTATLTTSGIVVLPSPTNSQTDTLNLAVNWKGDNSYMTASYFGSFYQNNINSVQWTPYNTSGASLTNTLQTLSVSPNNSLNQLNLNGGYDFSKKTKLTSNLSISQNIQNDSYSGTYDPFMVNTGTLPSSSLNGLVNTMHADVKVTDQSIKDLALTAAFKFDERDNLTQSNLYQFYSNDGYKAYSSTSAMGYQPNAPVSNKQNQLIFGGDYKITKDQKLGLTLANNSISRWCNQYGPAGSVYANSPNCVTATSSNENKADLLYKLRATEDIALRAGVGYSNRKTNSDNQVYATMPEQAAQKNAGDYQGFYPFFEASRKQYLAKASVDWQALENLAFKLGGKYTNDLYYDSTYGVLGGNSWSLNFDGNYAYSEAGTLSGYATQQNSSRNLTNQASSGSWNNKLNTNTTTLGLGVKHGGLLDGKLTLMGDATYSTSISQYNTTLYPVTANCLSSGATPATFQCGMLPGIQNNLGIIKLGGSYQLDKNSKVGLMYWYQHLYSNDYYYTAYTMGTNPTSVLPTNQSSPSYNVNVISANYTYTFD